MYNLCFLRKKEDVDLTDLIQANDSAKLAITTFLQNLKLYLEKSGGCILDLMGEDNIVLCKKGNDYSVIINNSAVKMWKFTLCAPDYLRNHSIPQIKFLCKLTGIEYIYANSSKVLDSRE